MRGTRRELLQVTLGAAAVGVIGTMPYAKRPAATSATPTSSPICGARKAATSRLLPSAQRSSLASSSTIARITCGCLSA